MKKNTIKHKKKYNKTKHKKKYNKTKNKKKYNKTKNKLKGGATWGWSGENNGGEVWHNGGENNGGENNGDDHLRQLEENLDELYDYYEEHNNLPVIIGGFALFLYGNELQHLYENEGWQWNLDHLIRIPNDIDLWLPYRNGPFYMTPYPDTFTPYQNVYGIDTINGTIFHFENGLTADVVRNLDEYPLIDTQHWSEEEKIEELDRRTHTITYNGKEYRVLNLQELHDQLRDIPYNVLTATGKDIDEHESKIEIIRQLLYYFNEIVPT